METKENEMNQVLTLDLLVVAIMCGIFGVIALVVVAWNKLFSGK